MQGDTTLSAAKVCSLAALATFLGHTTLSTRLPLGEQAFQRVRENGTCWCSWKPRSPVNAGIANQPVAQVFL